MLLANKRQENQVKTYITYNKGRDWRLLQAPATDLAGNDIHCVLVSSRSESGVLRGGGGGGVPLSRGEDGRANGLTPGPCCPLVWRLLL